MQPVREKPYPSDVSDEEWAFTAPYLSLLPEGAVQRRHNLREVFNALKWLVRAGAPWRLLPHDFPPWEAVYQQTMRWLAAGAFEAMVYDLRVLLRDLAGRKPRPSAAVLDSRTLRSTPAPRLLGPPPPSAMGCLPVWSPSCGTAGYSGAARPAMPPSLGARSVLPGPGPSPGAVSERRSRP